MNSTNKIIVYTTHCPACLMLVSMLDKKGIPYSLIDDDTKVRAAAASINTNQVPLCLLPGESKVRRYAEVLNYINSL